MPASDFGPFGGSKGGKFDWEATRSMLANWAALANGGLPPGAGKLFPLSGGQPRTFTPGPMAAVPYMPAPVMGGPQTFQSNLGMGPTTPQPQQQALTYPQVQQQMPPARANFGMGSKGVR